MPFSKTHKDWLQRCLLVVLLSSLAGCSLFRGKSATPADEPVPADDAMIGQSEEAPLQLPPNPYFENMRAASDTAMQRFEQGIAAMRSQNWAAGQSAFASLIKNYPNFSGPHVNLGIIAREQGDLIQAKQHFLHAIEVNPANQEAYNQLALLQRKQGKFKQAEQTFLQAIAIWPGYASIRLNLGILYELYMGEMESALEQYEYYQRLQSEPDKKIAGWIIDLQRRIKVASR